MNPTETEPTASMESPRPSKRRRVSDSSTLTTPPTTDQSTPPNIQPEEETTPDDLPTRATHVLATEAAALSNITHFYRTSATARQGLKSAAAAITAAQAQGGKLITCGVGKSAYVAQKLTATCKSLGISSSFLHACEALHGDLGDVRERDVLLFVSFSGKTPELLGLLPHLPEGTRVMALSSPIRSEDCMLLEGRRDGVLLPAPIPEREEVSFGVAAPTTSTTVALAVADMLALTVAGEMHRSRGRMADVFKRNHPGGAIGLSQREVKKLKREGEDLTVVELPSPSISASDDG